MKISQPYSQGRLPTEKAINAKRFFPLHLNVLIVWYAIFALPCQANNREVSDERAFAFDFDSLVRWASMLIQSKDIGILVGHAFWVDPHPDDGLTVDEILKISSSDIDELPPGYGARNGVFEMNEVAYWDLPDAAPKAGHGIEFRSPSKRERGEGGSRDPSDFRDSFNLALPKGRRIPCLVLMQDRNGAGRLHRTVFQLSEVNEDVIQDIRSAMAIAKARPGASDFDEWYLRVSGPLSMAVLLRILSREPDALPVISRFAVQVIDGGDPGLLHMALGALASSPAEVLQEVEEEDLSRVARVVVAGVGGTESIAGSQAPAMIHQVLDIGYKHSPALAQRIARIAREELSPVIRALINADPDFSQRADAEELEKMLERIDRMAGR